MKPSTYVYTALQIALLAIQFLVPAFTHLSSGQEVALASFISGVQATLGAHAAIKSGSNNPEPPAAPPIVPAPTSHNLVNGIEQK